MNEQKPFISEFLKSELASRQRKREGYSLRAFANFLGIHPGTLSSAISGKRKLPKNALTQIAERLNISPMIRENLLNDLRDSDSKIPFNQQSQAHLLDEQNHFHILSEWEHYALLSLSETEGFTGEVEEIASKLQISSLRSEVVLTRLLDAKLLKKDSDGLIKRNSKPLKTTHGISSTALRKAHKEELEIIKEKLDVVDFDVRDVSSITMPVNVENIPEAKKLIKKFKNEMSTLLEKGKKTEVYNLNVQLMPLTKVKSLKENEK